MAVHVYRSCDPVSWNSVHVFVFQKGSSLIDTQPSQAVNISWKFTEK